MKEIEYLKKLISFKTDGNEIAINNCLKFIEKELLSFGWKTIMIKNNEDKKNSLIAVFNGQLSNIHNGLLLAGHIDTVQTNDTQWDSNPEKLMSKNGNLYGLGVADMKAFTATVLSNLETISKLKLKKPIVFILTNDEETVMYSINKVCDFLKNNNILPQYAIIGEPSLMTFSNSNKGFYEFETKIIGKSCHSSKPNNGINAIYIMSKVITFLESLSKKYMLDDTTINVGVINGGRMCNIVADECKIRWDVRTFLNKNLIAIKKEVDDFLMNITREYVGSSFFNDIVFKIPVFEAREVKITQELMKKYFIKEKPYDAATEAGFYQELGMDCVIYGCGDIKDAHSINEKIIKNNFLDYSNKIINFIKYICC